MTITIVKLSSAFRRWVDMSINNSVSIELTSINSCVLNGQVPHEMIHLSLRNEGHAITCTIFITYQKMGMNSEINAIIKKDI